MLDPQAAKDRDLGHVVEENLRTSTKLKDNFVSFTLIEPSKYKLVTKGLTDYLSAAKYGYNVMITLIERNDTKVRTGRSQFWILGYDATGTQIFEVFFSAGAPPRVTLMGPYEGHVWEPNSGN